MVEAVPLTDLIHRAQSGDEGALRQVFDTTYQDLHRMARKRIRQVGPATLLDTTSLVHESFLRFANAGELAVNDRAHFFRYAGHVMRSVIVDMARARQADRRGGNAQRVQLNTSIGDAAGDGEAEVLRVHEALEELGALDARMPRWWSCVTSRDSRKTRLPRRWESRIAPFAATGRRRGCCWRGRWAERMSPQPCPDRRGHDVL